MPIGDYLLSKIIKCLYFGSFFGNLKKPKFPSEIKWPLGNKKNCLSNDNVIYHLTVPLNY